jgi:hypothetical protein
VRIWRLLATVLAVPVMLGGLVLVTAGPAAACSCARISEAEVAARVDAVFVGTLVSSRVDPSVVLTFEVSRVYKGAVGKRQEIVIPPAATRNGTCGFYVPAGPGPWLLFAYRSSGDSTLQLDPGQYLSTFGSVCPGGSRALAAGGEPALGGPPAGAPGGPDSWPSLASLVVDVGVLAAGVVGGLGLAAFRARRRASAD